MNRVTFWHLSQLKNFPNQLSQRGRTFPSGNYNSAIDSHKQPAIPELRPDKDTLPYTNTDESLQDQDSNSLSKSKDMPKKPPNDIFLL